MNHSRTVLCCLLLFAILLPGCGPEPTVEEAVSVDDFVTLCSMDQKAIDEALTRIEENWRDSYLTLLVDAMQFVHKDSIKARHKIPEILLKEEGIRDVKDPQQILKKIWAKEYNPHPDYADFKSKLHSRIDPSFEEYFDNSFTATIRLDEIRWGGVKQDGIPPLDHPKVIPAEEATYLEDSNVVFGVFAGGKARCYPKRILAWHEMVKDTVGGVSLNGVYCTLCGSMIVYRTEFDGKHYELGTSGFLYRSNKLMYDHGTKSLWSTITGEPVVGLLVGKKIRLPRYHVVTTTWGEWKKRHPDTTVLSLDTGHQRDYGEGVAYGPYFSNDELMFEVPLNDTRLKNKAEVLALKFEDTPDEQLAISATFLTENRIYQGQIGNHNFVVVTDESGANRVYESMGEEFQSIENGRIKDSQGNEWSIEEEFLVSGDQKRQRLPAHRVFWFGWVNVYPETRLVK